MQWVISKFKCRVVNVEHLYWAGNPFLMEGGSIFRDLIPVSLSGASATNWIAALCRLVSWSFFRVDQIWAVHRPAQHSMKGEIRQLEFAPHFVMNYRGPMLSTSSEWFIDSHECLSLYQWLIAWQSQTPCGEHLWSFSYFETTNFKLCPYGFHCFRCPWADSYFIM